MPFSFFFLSNISEIEVVGARVLKNTEIMGF